MPISLNFAEFVEILKWIISPTRGPTKLFEKVAKPLKTYWFSLEACRRTGVKVLALEFAFLAVLFHFNELKKPKIDQNELSDLLHGLCWIGYDPKDFDPATSPNPSLQSLKRDLDWIHAAGFTGVVTFACRGTLCDIPELAKDRGFAVIAGVWDPGDGWEVRQAINMQESVDAYCVGHNGLNKPRAYNFEELSRAIQLIRLRTSKPVTTSEEARYYQPGTGILLLGDWLFPDVHISLREATSSICDSNIDRDVLCYVGQAKRLAALSKELGKPLLLKAVVYPYGGATGASLQTQDLFFSTLIEELRDPLRGINHPVSLAVHSAFDAPWKQGFPFYSWDPYTGLLENDGVPRPAASSITNLCH